jgi:PPIC-type PPIASE domain
VSPQAVRALTFAALLPALVSDGACRRRPAPPAPDVAARIGDGEEIRYSEFQAQLARTLGDSETLPASDVLSQLFEQFLDERLLLRFAVERRLVGAGATPRQAIDTLLRETSGPPPSAAEIAAFYSRHQQEFARPERVRLRQILTQDRKTAERARQAIQHGEDFAAVARRLSRDASAAAGGYQGELGRADLPPALVEAIFALRPGEVSRVVPAGYGFHLFQVTEKLPAQLVPLAAARTEIDARLRRERGDRAMAALVRQARDRYNVEVYERNLPFDYEGSYVENHAPKPIRSSGPPASAAGAASAVGSTGSAGTAGSAGSD